MQYLNIITCTYKRHDRIQLLDHLKGILMQAQNIRWIVVDDSDQHDQELSDFLPDFAKHLFVGPSNDKGHMQRNLALEYIYDNSLDGLIYNADDDNRYDPNILTILRETKKFSILPVGNLGPNGIEKAILVDGKFKEWDAGWIERKYPVDMASFCFDYKLLSSLAKPFWSFAGIGGESEFIDKLVNSVDEIEFLAHENDPICVWHNGLLA